MILNEIAMNFKTFRKSSSIPGLKIGFEFEMIAGSKFVLPLKLNVKFLNTFEKMKLFFDIRSDDMKDIHKKYGKDFKIEDPKAFIDEYSLDPYFGWVTRGEIIFAYDADEGPFIKAAESIAKSLEELGIEVTIFDSYHDNLKNPNKWYIEPDGSIKPDVHTECGFELVSPIMDFKEAFSIFDKISNWAAKNEVYTNDSTGFHVNISIPDIMLKLDPLKLVILLGEDNLLAKFDREFNEYAQSHSEKIKYGVKGQVPKTMSIEDFISLVKDNVSFEKKYSVNFSKLKNDYIEFRALGGYHYLNRTTDIKNAIHRFIAVLVAACDPEMYREEYLKKLSLLKNKSEIEFPEDIIPVIEKSSILSSELLHVMHFKQNTLWYIVRAILIELVMNKALTRMDKLKVKKFLLGNSINLNKYNAYSKQKEFDSLVNQAYKETK